MAGTAMLAYAVKLTETTDASVDALREAGRSDGDILAATLDTSIGGCRIPRPVIMTDHSQPPWSSPTLRLNT